MNIPAIGNFYQNNFVKRNNNTTFGQGCLMSGAYVFYNPQRTTIDQTVFSNKRCLTDIEVCKKMLKEEKGRFTPKEEADLNKQLGTYRTFKKKALLLEKLLDVKSSWGEQLDADDIIAFLYVTDGSTSKEQDALCSLLKYELEEYSELNKRVFVPLENCPKMLGELNKINKTFRNLPEEDRGQLMSLTFDVVKDSNYAYAPLSQDIAKKINKCPLAYEILYEAAYTLANSRNQKNNKNKFKVLLNSFTDDRMKQIENETKNFHSAEQERKYIDNYLRKYNIN